MFTNLRRIKCGYFDKISLIAWKCNLNGLKSSWGKWQEPGYQKLTKFPGKLSRNPKSTRPVVGISTYRFHKVNVILKPELWFVHKNDYWRDVTETCNISQLYLRHWTYIIAREKEKKADYVVIPYFKNIMVDRWIYSCLPHAIYNKSYL